MTFGWMLLAETGDNTQLAVAGMAGALPAVPCWSGARFSGGPYHELKRCAGVCAFMNGAGPEDHRAAGAVG